ncbi:hypothetical protein Bateq7PJ16_0786 [Bacillus subtilis]|nr:hypothetical protein Bateq7PJ16_0786 [Bacillus subtilis]
MEIQFENISMGEIWSSASFYFEFLKYEKVSKGDTTNWIIQK